MKKSEIAKQAAEEIIDHCIAGNDYVVSRDSIEYYIQTRAIDAATAKLREELAIMKECYQKGLSYDAYELAHQQPSAQCKGCNPATTPEVEELLNTATHAILSMPKDRQTYEHYRAEVERLFTQAREPLVKALKPLVELAEEVEGHLYEKQDFARVRGMAKDALAIYVPLTGTEEKK